MANELLDFVIALVRDPDVAARYAADPDGAIAAAHLSGVSSADVANLLPMVSDSLSMSTAAPSPGFDAPDASAGNVWTSGAATAAFDAFTPHGTTVDQVFVDHLPPSVIDVPPDQSPLETTEPAVQSHQPLDDGLGWSAEEIPGHEPAPPLHAHDTHDAHDAPHGFDPGHVGFDIFE